LFFQEGEKNEKETSDSETVDCGVVVNPHGMLSIGNCDACQ